MTRVVRGLEAHDELDPGLLRRDPRPLWRIFLSTLNRVELVAALLIACGLVAIVFPVSLNLMLLVGPSAFIGRWVSSVRETLPFRVPITANRIDYSDRAPGSGRATFRHASGIFLLGNALRSLYELWLSMRDMLTHVLILGTTGSGKTEAMVSLAFNALAMGSGFSYLDPKGAPRLPAQIYTLCRLCGVDDNFRVLNYMTGQGVRRGPVRLTNRTNPYAYGTAAAHTQMLVSLIPASQGDNAIFGQKAQALASSLLLALEWLSNKGEIALSVRTIRDWMALPRYIELAERRDMPPAIHAALRAFLESLGWKAGIPIEKQPRSLPEQFAYAHGYFAQVLSSLTDTYGHIYLEADGEVDMYDVVKNRRVLVTVLPSLEKSPEECKNLGKLTLSAIRNAISIGLGSRIEGTIEDVLESLPVASRTPFLSITDEYAAIGVRGYAECLTQGRGLGVSAIVGSQDYAGMKREDEIGAQQMVANTKLKFAMKMEDPQDTWHLFRDLAGDSEILQTEGYRIEDDGRSLSFRDKRSASFSRVGRIHIRDLQEQIEGEFHAFFNGKVVRGNMFYADVPLKSHQQVRINELLIVPRPDERALRMRFGDIGKLTDTLISALRSGATPANPDSTPDIAARLMAPFNRPGKLGRMEQAICAFMALGEQTRSNINFLRKPKTTHATKNTASPNSPTILDNNVSVVAQPSEDTQTTNGVAASAKSEPAKDWQKTLHESTKWCLDALGDSLEEDVRRGEQLLGAGNLEAEPKTKSVIAAVEMNIAYPDPPVPTRTVDAEDKVMSAINRLLTAAGAGSLAT